MSAAKKMGKAESQARQAFASVLQEDGCPLWNELTKGCTRQRWRSTLLRDRGRSEPSTRRSSPSFSGRKMQKTKKGGEADG